MMAATIYHSHLLAQRMADELRAAAVAFRLERQRPARLTQIVAGHDSAAAVYSRQLERSCRAVGLDCVTLTHPFEVEEEELCKEVAALSRDVANDGVVLLLPLPAHIRQRMVTEALHPEKDVDGLGPRNAGHLLLGYPSFVPSTADAVLAVLDDAQIPIAGRNAVIVGRSNIGGKPIAFALMRRDATVTMCHSHTHDLPAITRDADILVVSVGRPGLITADMVKPGAVVLDAGINLVAGKVVGDVEVAVSEVAALLTAVPGGIGPLIHLALIRHTLQGPQ
jgi:methylenetetrahydrofolate dehydrogenase (NADP+)/methenyltetrahydrofolate cyclohydrolase